MQVKQMFDLTGKVAVVTGGGRGLGRFIAQGLAEAGANVVIASRKVANCEKAAEEISRLGVRAVAVKCDTAVEGDIASLVDVTLKEFGTIDILVNNAGITWGAPTLEYPLDKWDKIFAVNVRGVWILSQKAANVMKDKGGGKIINISSVRAFQGRLNDAAYAPSKGAVNQLTHSMAIEWGPRGINVNALAPVFTRTAMAAPQLDNPQTRAWILSRIAMKRPGELDDLFGPIVFLASDASNFVNGHVLVVDGGWLAT